MSTPQVSSGDEVIRSAASKHQIGVDTASRLAGGAATAAHHSFKQIEWSSTLPNFLHLFTRPGMDESWGRGRRVKKIIMSNAQQNSEYSIIEQFCTLKRFGDCMLRCIDDNSRDCCSVLTSSRDKLRTTSDCCFAPRVLSYVSVLYRHIKGCLLCFLFYAALCCC